MLALAIARAQLRMTRRDMEDLFQIGLIPLMALVLLAIARQSGRPTLMGYAVIAPLLISVAQMSLWVASELVTRDRYNEVLELLAAAPTSFFIVLALRILVVSSVGVLGLVESWLIARVVFGVAVSIVHWDVFIATLLLTVFSAAATSLITAAAFTLASGARTYQNSLTYPLYVLGGVMVPASYLPSWLRPVSSLVYLSWSSDLLRDSLLTPYPANAATRLAVLAGLGVIALLIGYALFARLLHQARTEGSLSLR